MDVITYEIRVGDKDSLLRHFHAAELVATASCEACVLRNRVTGDQALIDIEFPDGMRRQHWEGTVKTWPHTKLAVVALNMCSV